MSRLLQMLVVACIGVAMAFEISLQTANAVSDSLVDSARIIAEGGR